MDIQKRISKKLFEAIEAFLRVLNFLGKELVELNLKTQVPASVF